MLSTGRHLLCREPLPAQSQGADLDQEGRDGRKGEEGTGSMKKGKYDCEHELSLLQKTDNVGHPASGRCTASVAAPVTANGGPDHNCHSSADKSVGGLLPVPHWLGP